MDLIYCCSFAAKRIQRVRGVFRQLSGLPYAPVMEEGLDATFCQYRTFREGLYVSNLCPLPAAQLVAWGGRFMKHPDAVCCEKDIWVSHFHYEDLPS